ncbi:hypothetical protein AB0383_19220 [Amycolatopsis sp. NPDC051373]|uniref:hypothetical protein n=1 Tax=Amycolatopsis sp. NPDC051373 TaxID=3155801 RepID=UPI00344DF953
MPTCNGRRLFLPHKINNDPAAAEARLSDACDRLKSDRRPVGDELSNSETIAQLEALLLLRGAKDTIDKVKNRLWDAQRRPRRSMSPDKVITAFPARSEGNRV